MHRLLRYSSFTLLAIAMATSQAYAENAEHYCKHYADRAVHLAEVVRSVSSCRHLVTEAPQRWSLNYQQHFSYCLRIFGSGHGMEEDETRAHEAKFCAGP